MAKVWTFEEDPALAIERWHCCPNAKLMRAILEDDDADKLVFPIGPYGYGMPGGTPFVVTAAEPCRVCGALPSMWAQWKQTLVVAL